MQFSQSRSGSPKGAVRVSLALASFLSAMGVSASANASAPYAIWLQSEFKAPAILPCTTCHLSAAGGAGTTGGVPFADTMRGAGLNSGLTQDQFLAIVRPNSAGDSDHDGFSDAAEIAQEGNPNDPSVGPGGAAIEPYEYGCIGSNDEPEMEGMTPSPMPSATGTPTAMPTAAATSSSIAGAGHRRSPALWLMLAAAVIIAHRRVFR